MSEDLPKRRTCGTMEVDTRLMSIDPNYRANRRAIELRTRALASIFRLGRRTDVVTIPVVVHVVHNTDEQNISDDQIHSQIDVLNKDFRGLNEDRDKVPDSFKPVCVDTLIEFRLADVDPEGNPTNGITRTHTERNAFNTNDFVKFSNKGGHDVWPTDTYLNLWVCKLAGGVLGYAQFPGGPAETDGVVITYNAFGTNGTAAAPFNKGRTATHEIGHWLNLRHIWGDDHCGDDFVDDTPTHEKMNFGCPQFPHISCNNDPNGDMFMNYMDYTDDACMYMFTIGQAIRMDATLEVPRASLVKPVVKDIVMVGDPAIIMAPDGRLDIFVRASDNALWHKWQASPTSEWSKWENLSKDVRVLEKDMIGNPTVIRSAEGRLEIFVVASDNSLWHLREATPGGDWAPKWEVVK
jgi:hypothetical protein